jgi:hypothetical protein
MAAIVKLVAGTIRNQLELVKINEDYEKLLKPQMSTITKDFIDLICVYITNQRMQQCKPKIDTSSKSTVVKNTDDLLVSYFDHNSKIDMLAYKPTDDSGKMLGGTIASNFAAFGADAGKLFGAAAKKTGNPLGTLPLANSGKSLGALPLANAGKSLGALPLANSGADNAGNLGGTITAAGADPAKFMSTAQNSLSNAGIPEIPTSLLDATDVSALITSTKAKDIMDFYSTEVISNLKCNADMHHYIDNHIIKPVFDIAAKNIAEVGSQHLTDLAKTTTESHLKKCTLLIKGQLKTFDAILNRLSNLPADNTIPQLIIPLYINLLFELFVYSEYMLIVDMAVGINREDIKTYITNLKPFNVQIDDYIKDDKYPDDVMSMNGLKLPAEWKINEADKNMFVSKDIIIAEFKKLFKPVVVKAKGGKRKSRRKKHKTTYLPVTKHCSRRKRQ